MSPEIKSYHEQLSQIDREICELLFRSITTKLHEAENKIWHAHPVWFLDGNPIAGYSKLKDSVRLMFWSGADFGEPKLKPGSGKFKDASIGYTSESQVDLIDLERWLDKSRQVQWDYKNIVKRKGLLERKITGK